MKTLKKSNYFKSMIGILLILTVFMTMGARAQALEWKTANQVTLAWDSVTTRADGEPIGATDRIDYVVYLANAVTDPDKSNPVEAARVDTTTAVVTLGIEGKYWAGVKVIRIIEDGTEVGESIILWSDDPIATGAGKEFGLRYFIGPAGIAGLRPR